MYSIDQSILLNPHYYLSYFRKGSLKQELSDFEDAINFYESSIALNPNFPDTWNNLGNIYQEKNIFDKALLCFNKALEINPDFFWAHNNRGTVFLNQKKFHESIPCFEKAINLKHDFYLAYYNLASCYVHLNLFNKALPLFNKTINLKPNFIDAIINRGFARMRLNLNYEAIEDFDLSIRLGGDSMLAYKNRGDCYMAIKEFNKSIHDYNWVISRNPDEDFVLGSLLHSMMQICNWDNFSSLREKILNGLTHDKKVTLPFNLLALTDNPEIQKKANRLSFDSKSKPFPLSYQRRKKKITLGYFSSDFFNHATMHLLLEVLEKHNRDDFYIIGFSFSDEIKDPWAKRALESFDKFINVKEYDDKEVAKLSRDLGVDIAIDLKGITGSNRVGIFYNRPAPISINYLGYPSTMGADFMDFIVADPWVIPEENKAHYTEKIIYLPHCYQPNISTSNREVSNKNFTRSDFGLPENSFIFCCFNHTWKITPEIFQSWIEILRETKDSSLWLLESNQDAKINLQSNVIKNGISPERLIFAETIPVEEHLKRIPLADLFLDTFPYGAHTTASDSLRMGLPVLSLAGNSFASRVSSSLLNTLSMSDLITFNIHDYKSLAIDLRNNPKKLAEVRFRLSERIKSSPLFDSSMYVKNFEASLKTAFKTLANNCAQ